MCRIHPLFNMCRSEPTGFTFGTNESSKTDLMKWEMHSNMGVLTMDALIIQHGRTFNKVEFRSSKHGASGQASRNAYVTVKDLDFVQPMWR